MDLKESQRTLLLLYLKQFRSLKFGCEARFTAHFRGGQLHVKAVNLCHNHVCSRHLVSVYPKYRKLPPDEVESLIKLMQQMRPAVGRLKVYLKSKFAADKRRFRSL